MINVFIIGWFKPKKIKAKEDVQVKQVEDIPTPISIKPQDASSVKSQATTITSKPAQLLNTSGSTIGVEDGNRIETARTTDEIDALIEQRGQPWYKEALERKLKANEFRYRSEYGNPILGKF